MSGASPRSGGPSRGDRTVGRDGRSSPFGRMKMVCGSAGVARGPRAPRRRDRTPRRSRLRSSSANARPPDWSFSSTPMKVSLTPSAVSLRAKRAIAGISDSHGSHHEAKNVTTTDCRSVDNRASAERPPVPPSRAGRVAGSFTAGVDRNPRDRRGRARAARQETPDASEDQPSPCSERRTQAVLTVDAAVDVSVDAAVAVARLQRLSPGSGVADHHVRSHRGEEQRQVGDRVPEHGHGRPFARLALQPDRHAAMKPTPRTEPPRR